MQTNRAYLPAILDESRYLCLYGGAGSGKSWFAAQKILARCDANPGERFLVARKVHRTLKGSTFQLLKDVIALERFEVTINRSDMAIRFPNGSEILHVGLDDVEKVKSIAGITGMWIEEATEITEADFDQLDLRLRGATPTYKQILLSFNPISGRHWLRNKLVDTDRTDAKSLHTTWRDNAFIDPVYKRVLSQITDDNFKAIYDRGEWGEGARGLIYSGWRTTPTVPDVPPDAYGLDFGFNHPNALVAIWDRDPDLIVQEVIYRSNMTTPDLIREMQACKVADDIPIFCDHARPDLIEELVRAGFDALPANKEVLAGIQTVKGYNLKIHEQAENIISEISSYRWAEQRDGEIVDKPIKAHDDALDSVRYAIHTLQLERENTWGLW